MSVFSQKKRVAIVTTGGTIASLPGDEGRHVAGAIQGDELVAQLVNTQTVSLQVHSLFQKPSNAITPDDLLTLRTMCQHLIDAGEIDGIVITHGTDTLEETAYFLESSLRTGNVVVVVTGAQRVPHAVSSDADANLRDAITVAASDETKGLGVLVVFNETIHSASFVRKVSSYQLNGFESPALGCLGFVDGEAVLVYQMPRRQPCLVPATTHLPTVEMLNLGLGSGPLMLKALVDSDVQGIVLEGIGRGQVPPSWEQEVKRADEKGIVVLVCSSTLHGPVSPCYEYQASLYDLEQLGAMGVSGLSARKLRIRLMLALSVLGSNPGQETLRPLFRWGA
ncbi:asparaginase [Orrella sp. 11846]|uniref:asparaginase n=1 Tax=Orrella sp. 11846 TaxID=3409913 RepID=UPI003B599161